MPQVAEYRIGNTTIRIFDDACKGQAEVEEILRRISRLISRAKPDRGTYEEATRCTDRSH